uniref:Reverse transcriptase domain-containing protein n=1 Tax=Solanum lycopersicum TaxID=4081 RepID=A0A3Q7GJ62_SOLLC
MWPVTGLRVCMDYQKLNAWTEKDHFPMPFMDHMLDRLTLKGIKIRPLLLSLMGHSHSKGCRLGCIMHRPLSKVMYDVDILRYGRRHY